MRPRDHCWVCSVWGRTITSDIACAQSEEDRLAREVDDPTAILTQQQFQDLYTPRNFQTSAQTNTIQLRPIYSGPTILGVSLSANYSPYVKGPAIRDIIKQFYHKGVHRYGAVRFVPLHLA